MGTTSLGGDSSPDGSRNRVNQIELFHQRLADGGGLPAVLTASWEIFELIASSASTSADESHGMYPAFTFARGAAVSGRNAVAFAPSMPLVPGNAVPLSSEPASDINEAADALAGLASALSVRLRETAELAADAADRAACENAASEADRIAQLLARGH